MCWTNSRRVLITFCVAVALLAAPKRSWAECALWDWLFGHGQTTYAPPYCPPTVSVPVAGACGCTPAPCCPAPCAPGLPACQSCTPAATYRISYRPVPTVAYMPVVGIDPCSGCSVTTYRPTRAWTYQASLLPYAPYQVGYAPVPLGVGCGGCTAGSGCSSSCGCSACGTSCGGCSSCSSPYGGCSSCSGGCGTSGGCSSCGSAPAPFAGTPLPGASDMSQPPVTLSPSVSPSAPATIGPPATAPGSLSEPARTYVPGAGGAPISPSAPGGALPSGTSYRVPMPNDGNRTIEPLRIQNVPPIGNGLQPNAAPPARPENENLTTARPVLQASYFQLLQSAPPSVPAQMISTPAQLETSRLDDSGWRHVEN